MHVDRVEGTLFMVMCRARNTTSQSRFVRLPDVSRAASESMCTRQAATIASKTFASTSMLRKLLTANARVATELSMTSSSVKEHGSVKHNRRFRSDLSQELRGLHNKETGRRHEWSNFDSMRAVGVNRL